MGLFDGGMQGVFGAAFAPLFAEGTLHRVTRTDLENGDVTETFADAPIKYQPDRITDAMRRAEGFTDKDAAFIILQVGVVPVLSLDDQFTARSAPAEPERRWAINAPIESDPFGAHWIVRASPA